MTTQLRELLDRAAGPVGSEPDVRAAWRRGRRLRARRRAALGGSMAVVVLAAGLGIAIAANHTEHAPPSIAGPSTSAPPTTAPATAPVKRFFATSTTTPKTHASAIDIAGLQIADMTWTSGTHGWALGTTAACDAETRCPQALLRTTDGGAHWAAVETANTPVDCAFGCAQPDHTTNETNIRFATDEIGYAFGNGHADMKTSDGGHTWVAQPGRPVAALEVSGSTAVRVSYSHSGCPGPCDWGIETAPIGSNVWTSAPFPKPATGVGVQLLRSGPDDVYAAFFGHTAGGAADATTDLLVSHDGGRTWTSRGEPCAVNPKVENDSGAFAVAPGGVVAALCGPRGGNGNGDFVVTSRDGARTFGAPRLLPNGSFAGSLAMTSTENLLAGTLPGGDPGPGDGRLYASHDGGAHWTVVVTEGPKHPGETLPAREDILDFPTPTTGYWLGYDQTLWTTTDGGATWVPRTIG